MSEFKEEVIPPGAVLSDKDIINELNDNVVIIPFNREQLGSNSYDTTLGEYYYERDDSNIPEFFNPLYGKHIAQFWGVKADPNEHYGAKKASTVTTKNEAEKYGLKMGDQYILIKRGHIILAHTGEFLGGRVNVTTMMKARSTIGRGGLTIACCAGAGDTGYFNRYTYEIHNRNPMTVVLKVGERIGQIWFMRTGEVMVSYEKRGQYQQTTSITQLITQWDPSDMLPKSAIEYMRTQGPLHESSVSYTDDILKVLHKYVIPPPEEQTESPSSIMPKIENVVIV